MISWLCILAAAHDGGRFPLERVIDGERVVASSFTTAQCTEASGVSAEIFAVLELPFIEVLGERSAGSLGRIPLLRVVGGPRAEAEIFGAAEIITVLPVVALIRVLVARVVRALVLNLTWIARPVSLVARRAERIITSVNFIGNNADHEPVLFDSVIRGPLEVGESCRVGATDAIRGALAVGHIDRLTNVEVADDEGHVVLQLVGELSKDGRVNMIEFDALRVLAEDDSNPDHITVAFFTFNGVELGLNGEWPGGINCELLAGSVLLTILSNLLPRLSVAMAAARITIIERSSEAVLVGLHKLDTRALGVIAVGWV